MKIDFSKEILSIDGKPFEETVEGVKRKITIKTVAVNALLANLPDDEKKSGEDKLKRYRLAMKIQDSEGMLDTTTEEVSLTKELVAKTFPIMIYGRYVDLVEGIKDSEAKK